MTRDDIVALFDRRQDALDRRDPPALARLYADHCVVESPMAGTHQGRAAVEEVYGAWFRAFPDVVFKSEELLIDGDRAAQVGTMVGTDIGGFMGLPPTGRPFRLPIVFLYQLHEQQILHERRIYDFTGLLVQVGVLKAKSPLLPALGSFSRPNARASAAITREDVISFFARRKEAYERHDITALAGQHAEDSVVENPWAGAVKGREAIAHVYEELFKAFPDLLIRDEGLLIDGNRVAQTATSIGTDIGGFMSLTPTRRKFSVPIVFLFMLEDRQIVHERRIYDFTGLLVQIGVLKARPA